MNVQERRHFDVIRSRVATTARYEGQSIRFGEERDRFEERVGVSFLDATEGLISGNKLYAIESGEYDLIKVLSKGNAWLYLAKLGFDLPYIVWGNR